MTSSVDSTYLAELPKSRLDRILHFCAGKPFYQVFLGQGAIDTIRAEFQAVLQEILVPASVQQEGEALARLHRAGFILSPAQLSKARKYGGLGSKKPQQLMIEDKRKEEKPHTEEIVVVECEPEVGDTGPGESTRSHCEGLKPLRVA